uniref:Uncharacterized protein n=1 Tax=Timema poppense TaxID=170557 RepID=A0A7R9GW42_TIMPO|nr:unnamed protein product [Timema poppensis]
MHSLPIMLSSSILPGYKHSSETTQTRLNGAHVYMNFSRCFGGSCPPLEWAPHVKILRDIRQGLLQIGRESGRSGLPGDDTYMYDDDARCAGMGQHWYDEPPYESDPEDFLMGTTGQAVPTATIQNGSPVVVYLLAALGVLLVSMCFPLAPGAVDGFHSPQLMSSLLSQEIQQKLMVKVEITFQEALNVGLRLEEADRQVKVFHSQVCFTLNLRSEPRGEGVISLRSAGDISIPRDPSINGTSGTWIHPPPPSGAVLTPRGSARRGLLLPQSGPYPATIIPLGVTTRSRSSRDRESGDYAGSDVQSIGSRLSTMSIETSRSEQMEGGVSALPSPSYMFPQSISGKGHPSHKMVSYTSRSSTSQSSDYEDQEEGEQRELQQLATVHASDSGVRTVMGSNTMTGRMRGMRHDTQRKTSKVKPSGDGAERIGEAFPSTSSIESLPSGSGSSTQALVPAGSNHSSLSAEDRDLSPGVPQTGVVGKARALVDYTPSPYDKDALKFKKGDLIEILSMNASGLWRGCAHGRVGMFKFINVEVLTGRRGEGGRQRMREKFSARGRPQSVEDLLQRINLEEHISVFVLNGYEDLELFKDLEEEDLDYLGINNPEHRAKILTAVELLHDYDSPGSPEDTDGDGPVTSSDDDDHTSPGHPASEGPPSIQGHQHDVGNCLPLHYPHYPHHGFETGPKELSHSHHRHHHHHKKLSGPGPVPQHHHHHKSSSRRSPICGVGQEKGEILRAHKCAAAREIPNNLDTGLAVLHQRLMAQQQCGEIGETTGTTAESQCARGTNIARNPANSDPTLGSDASEFLPSQHFLPNIPVTSTPTSPPPSSTDLRCPTSASSSPVRTPIDFKADSYIVARGKLVAVESCKKNVNPSTSSPVSSIRCSSNNSKKQQVLLESPSSRRSPSSVFGCIPTNANSPSVARGDVSTPPLTCGIIEESCETNPKLTMVKYVVGGSSDLGLGCESGNVNMGSGRGGCFSEKSSDSGVSSSSLSSANPRENCVRKEGRGGHITTATVVIESPTRVFANFSSANNNRSSPTIANNKSQSLMFQSAEKSSYQ